MKTNRFLLLISVVCFSLFATGCGEPLQELTSEEEAIISLYSAKAVAKFNKNQVIGIANARVKKGELEDLPDVHDNGQEETEEELAEEIEGEEITEEENNEQDQEDVVPEEQSEESESHDGGYSFTNAVDIEGVSFTCSQFEVSSEYKPNSSFILSSVKGKKYVVLEIDAKNESDKTVDFSKYSQKQYSLKLNGGSEEKTQFTPLTNDLANYKGQLAAGESKPFVLVFLFSESVADDITSLELLVTSDGTTRGTNI